MKKRPSLSSSLSNENRRKESLSIYFVLNFFVKQHTVLFHLLWWMRPAEHCSSHITKCKRLHTHNLCTCEKRVCIRFVSYAHTNWLYYAISDSYPVSCLLSFPLANLSSVILEHTHTSSIIFRRRLFSLYTVFLFFISSSSLSSSKNWHQIRNIIKDCTVRWMLVIQTWFPVMLTQWKCIVKICFLFNRSDRHST